MPSSIRQKIWEFASVAAHDGPRIYQFKYEFENRQDVQQTLGSDTFVSEYRGPILSFRPQLAAETKDQRAILMTCRKSRQVFLELYPNRLNFTRPLELGEEYCEYPTPSIKYALFFDVKTDMICLSEDDLRRKFPLNVEAYFQNHVRNHDNPELNWPLWSDIENVGMDMTRPVETLYEKDLTEQEALHVLDEQMKPFWFLQKNLFNTDLRGCGLSTQLFVINFAPVRPGANGQPHGMTVNKYQPAFNSTMPGPQDVPSRRDRMSRGAMDDALDEARKVTKSVWFHPRLLVRSSDGQQLLDASVVNLFPDPSEWLDGEEDDDEAGAEAGQ